MRDAPRKHLHHDSPHWLLGEPDYFITICANPRGLNQLCTSSTGPQLLQSIAQYHDRQRWFCHLAVLMPDHVHFLLSFSPEIPAYSRVIGEWKKWAAKYCQITWQENFFDHRIRTDDHDRWKSEYIWQNPVRAGLVTRPEDWPYKWLPNHG